LFITIDARTQFRNFQPPPAAYYTAHVRQIIMNILDAVGNTSLVRLRKVVPLGGAAIFAKLEWENPTGSVKDRMARSVIARAEADGRLRPRDTVVEYTGGSTGASLGLVCAAKGYRLRIVTSDAFSFTRWARLPLCVPSPPC